MKRPALVLLLFGLAIIPLCRSQQSVSAESILAKVRQATGGDAWNRFAECRSEGTITLAGKTGTAVQSEDLQTGASVFRASISELGVHQARGVSGDYNWRQENDGYISLYPNSDPSEVDAFYLTRRAYFQQDLGGAKVRVLDASTEGGTTFDRLEFRVPGGRGFTLWINRSNHFIERVAGETTKYWSDYRSVDGILLPFAQREGDGEQAYLFTATKRTLLKSITEPDFAVPFQKDYVLPASGSATVPAEGGIVFQAKINGKGPYPVMFDTGSVNLMSAEFAKQLGLPLDGNPQKFGTPTGGIDAQTAHVDAVQIGDLVVRDQTF